MDLSIVIVSWNTKKLLDECLASIFRETKNLNFEIFVVDNNSSDGTAEMIKEKYPQTRLIKNKENCGFAAANNQAMKLATGKYILVLNPDTIFKNNAAGLGIITLEKYPEAAILGPKTFNADGSIQRTVRRDPSFAAAALIMTKLQHIFPRNKSLENYYCADFDYSREIEAEQVQGSFMLLRSEAAKKLNFFDEKFFIWFEEVDLCLRVRRAGYKILYSPEAEIIHYGGESFKQVAGIRRQKMFNRSLLYYFQKNKSRRHYLFLRLLEPLSLLLSALADIIKK
jgi:hypothetical protein